jgi:hypothetical protein
MKAIFAMTASGLVLLAGLALAQPLLQHPPAALTQAPASSPDSAAQLGAGEGSGSTAQQAPANTQPSPAPASATPSQPNDGSKEAPASGPPSWAPAATALVHPGIQTFTEGAQCTANFVFYDASDVYIGQAAHCAGTGAATDTNGCTAASLPLGTPVDLGTGHPGTLAYSSWLLMQSLKTPASAPECAGNDLALVRLDPADRAAANPAVPFFGGPVAVGPTAGLAAGDQVYSFGNSELRLGVNPVLSWKHGVVLSADAWTADLYTATPGIPGDSGSGFLDAHGNAIGVLSTVAIAPLPLSNQIGGLESQLAYRAAHGGSALALGTAPFTGGIV